MKYTKYIIALTLLGLIGCDNAPPPCALPAVSITSSYPAGSAPTNQSFLKVATGQSIQFNSAISSSLCTLSYAWKNGTNVVGTSSVYAVNSLQLLNAGSYSLVGTDTASTRSVTSNQIVIDVIPVPSPSPSPTK